MSQKIANQNESDNSQAVRVQNRLVAEVRASEMYYLHSVSQREIAKTLGCSISTVSRLLRDAQKHGIVEIHIKDPFSIEPQLAAQLCATFRLEHAVVVGARLRDEQALAEVIGRAAAQFAADYIRVGQKVGIAEGRTMLRMVDALPARSKGNRQIQVVPMLGGLNLIAPEFQMNTVCLRFARLLGGTPLMLHVPAVLSNGETVRKLMQEPSVQKIVRLWNELDIAFFGIGAEIPHSPMLSISLYSDEEIGELVRQGAVGDIVGRFFDLKGKPCKVAANKRLVAIPLETLKQVPVRIAIAGGLNKVSSILGALLGGYVSVLITDVTTALALLEKRSNGGDNI